LWAVPVDACFAYCGVYGKAEDALAYDAVHALHTEIGLIDAYDAAAIERKPDGRVKTLEKHETPTGSVAVSVAAWV
jgi:hypothetical protein